MRNSDVERQRDRQRGGKGGREYKRLKEIGKREREGMSERGRR